MKLVLMMAKTKNIIKRFKIKTKSSMTNLKQKAKKISVQVIKINKKIMDLLKMLIIR
jgi:hypothetical protein